MLKLNVLTCLLFTTSLYAAEPTIVLPANGCEDALLAIPLELARLKVTPEVLAVSDAKDRRVLRALIKILNLSNEEFLARLSQSIIENPGEPSKVETLMNPYFGSYPEQYRPFAATTLVTVRDQFADKMDAFELGLLSAMIPDSPRAFNWEENENLPFNIGRLQKLIISDLHRPALHRILKHLSSDPTFLIESAAQLNHLPSIRSRLKPAHVEKMLAQLGRGAVNEMDQAAIVVMVSTVLDRMEKWLNEAVRAEARNPPDDEPKHESSEREAFRWVVESYVTNALRFSTDVDALSVTLRALLETDPLPMGSKELRLKILASLEPIVRPILRRYQSVQPVRLIEPKSSALSVRTPLAPANFAPKDLFAPPPTGKKRARVGPAISKAPPADKLNSEAVQMDAAIDLHQFTSFVSAPRALDSLRPDLIYRFVFMRDRAPKLRSVRFSPEFAVWVKNNVSVGRQLLSAMNLGECHGQASGIKPVFGRSRRHDGPIYEVKIRGNSRALLVLKDGVWQVLRVVRVGDVLREIEWLESLPALEQVRI